MSSPAAAVRPGTLYIVATPIGHLRDITLRALDILRQADLVAAEDTRVTAGLLAAHGIQARLYAYHDHNERRAAPALIERLRAGDSIALVSDAGTPGISDPGAHLVTEVRRAGLPVVPVPGANAAATLASVAGDLAESWLFHGFLPAKSGARKRVLEALRTQANGLLFYESPHRILECVADLATVLGPERRLLIGRELTKLFESLHVCALGEAQAWLSADPDRQRGEFVLMVSGAAAPAADDPAAARPLLEALLEELPPSQAARLAARITGLRRSDLYDLARTLKPE